MVLTQIFIILKTDPLLDYHFNKEDLSGKSSPNKSKITRESWVACETRCSASWDCLSIDAPKGFDVVVESLHRFFLGGRSNSPFRNRWPSFWTFLLLVCASPSRQTISKYHFWRQARSRNLRSLWSLPHAEVVLNHVACLKMMAMRYGTLPLVHEGGICVIRFNPSIQSKELELDLALII